jgi:hypothetical protein
MAGPVMTVPMMSTLMRMAVIVRMTMMVTMIMAGGMRVNGHGSEFPGKRRGSYNITRPSSIADHPAVTLALPPVNLAWMECRA